MAYQQKSSSSTIGQLIGGIVALLIAVVGFTIGSSIFPGSTNSNVSVDPNAVVTCNGQTMNPDDICTHTFTSSTYNSGSYDDNYQQQAIYQQAQKQTNIADIIIDLSLFLGFVGLVILIPTIRNRQRLPVRR